jgi:hypothetical protein
MTMPGPVVIGGAVGIGAAQAKKAKEEIPGLVPGADAANAVIDGVTAARRWISDRHNLIRIAWFGSGVVLIIAGAVIISRPIQNAGKVTSTLLTGGKAANVIKKAAA